MYIVHTVSYWGTKSIEESNLITHSWIGCSFFSFLRRFFFRLPRPQHEIGSHLSGFGIHVCSACLELHIRLGQGTSATSDHLCSGGSEKCPLLKTKLSFLWGEREVLPPIHGSIKENSMTWCKCLGTSQTNWFSRKYQHVSTTRPMDNLQENNRNESNYHPPNYRNIDAENSFSRLPTLESCLPTPHGRISALYENG